METLGLIEELRAALRAPADKASFPHCRDLVRRIGSSLELDVKCSATERKLMERISEGVASVYLAYGANLVPDFGRATVPLKALESLVRTRATGVD